MHPDATRLFALDAALRAEADAMLAASGLGVIIAEAGYIPVGSYAMRAMTWRDLDFELYVDEVDWERHWQIGLQLARAGWGRRIVCSDGFRRAEQEPSYYWGLRVSDPALGCLYDDDERIWKLDLHMSTPEHFARALAPRECWAALMTEEARAEILALKEALCHTPDYRRAILSVHLYEAVLEAGVRGMKQFEDWHTLRFPRC
jgi:hypothetical protein